MSIMKDFQITLKDILKKSLDIHSKGYINNSYWQVTEWYRCPAVNREPIERWRRFDPYLVSQFLESIVMKKYFVDFRVSGSFSDTFDAESKEEIEVLLDEKLDDDIEYFLDINDVDDVTWHITEMHNVIRDGQKIWTTYVLKTDERCDDI